MLAGSCQQALTHLRWRPSGNMLTVTLRCGERTFVRGWPGQNPVGSPVWIGVIQHVTLLGREMPSGMPPSCFLLVCIVPSVGIS